MKGARRAGSASRRTGLALFACGILCACIASGARADGRFGDSAWVAPASSMEGDSLTAGPRVAERDHERRWETALRAPFRVVFFPLRLMALGLEAGAGYVGPRYLEPKAKAAPRLGPGLSPNVTLGSATDVGVGPAVTWIGFPIADATLRLATSWSTIDRRRARLTETIGERRAVGFRLLANYDYKPNRRYFGIGNQTPVADASYYLLASTNVEAAVLLGASPLRQLRVVGGYSSVSPGRGYHATPLLENVFAPNTTPFERQTTQELTYGVTADLATLDDERDPSLGAHARVDLRRAAGLRAGDPEYSQWRVEARAYLPVFAKRRVIAVRGVYAGVEPKSGATMDFPFYRLASSDGINNFVGYSSGRFRDRQLMLGRVEYRWMIIHRVSALALYELGEVAPSMGAFTYAAAHSAFGGGLRLGLSDASTIRVELAHSVEGVHAVLELGGDF